MKTFSKLLPAGSGTFFVASQMLPAIFDSDHDDISAGDYTFRATALCKKFRTAYLRVFYQMPAANRGDREKDDEKDE